MEAKTKMQPGYKTLATEKNVLIKFPRANDETMPYIEKHKFLNDEGRLVEVASHFKVEDYYNKNIVIRNFFIYPGLRGQWLVVDEVSIVEKNDKYRNKKTIIIDIKMKGLDAGKLAPKSKLSIGCSSGRVEIPGAPGYFIDFKPMGK